MPHPHTNIKTKEKFKRKLRIKRKPTTTSNREKKYWYIDEKSFPWETSWRFLSIRIRKTVLLVNLKIQKKRTFQLKLHHCNEATKWKWKKNDMTWFDVKNVLQSSDLFYLHSFLLHLRLTLLQSSQIVLLIERWLRDSIFAGICENDEQEPVQTLLTVGKLNVFLWSQCNKFAFAFAFFAPLLYHFQMVLMKKEIMKERKKYINKWTLDGRVGCWGTWRKVKKMKNYVMREIASQSNVHQWQTFHSLRFDACTMQNSQAVATVSHTGEVATKWICVYTIQV